MAVRLRTDLLHSIQSALGAGTVVIFAAANVPLGQRVGIYRVVAGGGVAAGTFVFQDTASNPISALYNLAINASPVVINPNTPNSMDPLFQTGPNVGLQLVTTGGPLSFDVWYYVGL